FRRPAVLTRDPGCRLMTEKGRHSGSGLLGQLHTVARQLWIRTRFPCVKALSTIYSALICLVGTIWAGLAILFDQGQFLLVLVCSRNGGIRCQQSTWPGRCNTEGIHELNCMSP